MTIDEVRAFDPQIVVIALTSTEPHGAHLPYGTDFYIGDGIVRDAVRLANRQGARVLMHPALPVGNNVNFRSFPFACRIKVRTYMNLLLDLIEAWEEDGIRKIVLVNSHGGNTDTIRAVLREHFESRRADGADRAFVSFCRALNLASAEAAKVIVHRSDHAGESETSLIQHFQPALVRSDKLSDQPVVQPEIGVLRSGKVHFVRAWEKYLPTSGGGDSRESQAQKGKTLADSAARGLADYFVELAGTPWHAGFPYSR